MSHLAIETIARLVDDPPNAAESEHLVACDACRTELESMRDDIHALGTLPDMSPAPDAWDTLHARLAAEGLIRTERPAPFRMRTAFQAAAAVILFLGGSLLGRATMTPEQVFVQAPAPDNRDVASLQQTPVDAQLAAEPAVLPDMMQRNPNVTLASTSTPLGRPVLARTMEEAAAMLRQTEELYLGALTRYAEIASQSEAGDPVARLAALQSIVMTTQAALNQAPTDPVINGYHLTALAQRDATLRQVAAATSDRWY